MGRRLGYAAIPLEFCLDIKDEDAIGSRKLRRCIMVT